ncbi:hypothetical protein NE237_021939 [Protea cynaroides]|uniref:Uncharacterized protein n=1 Tax=Protea cynaroides TaxID=273540 RepID=A0A9Q0K326_9MAGN|nr:hypothetical protein NE237_021939 [Protea cynaroides]
MILPLKPNFSTPLRCSVSVSVLVGRRDINKLGYAPNFLRFAPTISWNILKICSDRAFVTLLFMPERSGGTIEFRIFGTVLDFGVDVKCEYDALLLLRILDWD